MFQEIRAGLVFLILFTLLTGFVYPFVVKGTGDFFFPSQTAGSLIESDGKIIGSTLIGQNFSGESYFHPRPSAAGTGYDAANSSGSNLAPTSPDLLKTIAARVADIRKSDDNRPIPVDLVTSSGSGLDPDISPASANFQAARVAAARGLTMIQIQNIIAQNTTPPQFGFLGEARVNVLALNRALDLQHSGMP